MDAAAHIAPFSNDYGLNIILLAIRIFNVHNNGYPLENKLVTMRTKDVWLLERIWAENPNTVQTRISKEAKRFSRRVKGSSASC